MTIRDLVKYVFEFTPPGVLIIGEDANDIKSNTYRVKCIVNKDYYVISHFSKYQMDALSTKRIELKGKSK